MTPAVFLLLVMACPTDQPPGSRECVAVIVETDSVAGCRATYREIKATLPANLALGFPECTRKKESKS